MQDADVGHRSPPVPQVVGGDEHRHARDATSSAISLRTATRITGSKPSNALIQQEVIRLGRNGQDDGRLPFHPFEKVLIFLLSLMGKRLTSSWYLSWDQPE